MPRCNFKWGSVHSPGGQHACCKEKGHDENHRCFYDVWHRPMKKKAKPGKAARRK